MIRPVRYFLSHQNGDRAALVRLETDMRRRGLLSWRDRKDQARGVATDPAVVKAIGEDTDGFVLYGSTKVIDSEYVWTREWPLAFVRTQAEDGAGHAFPYPLVPIFVGGTSIKELKAAAVRWKQPLPTTFNGERLRPGRAGRRQVANFLLATALERVAAETGMDLLRVHLTTFPVSAGIEADLVVDWAADFEPGVSAPWDDLLAARDDLADAIARTGRAVEVSVQARLGPAFAFGRAFPRVSRIDVTVGDGWRLGTTEDASLVTVADEVVTTGDRRVAVVEIGLGRSIVSAVDDAIVRFDLSPSHRLTLAYGRGVDRADAAVAAAATAAFERRMKAIRDGGVTEAHVFLAGPAPLAFLLGAAVNAGPAVTLYHTADGEYVRSVRLP